MHIIMNPPYSRNLHLKILREAMKHSDDIVSLSPIRWLQDPSGKYKKNSDFNKFTDICERISDVDVIDAKDATTMFGAEFWNDLAITHITKAGGFDYANFWKCFANAATYAIIEKIGKPVYIDKTMPSIISEFGKNDNLPYWVNCPRCHGHIGKKDEFDIVPMKFELSLNKQDKEHKNVYFATKEEAENFYNSLRTKFYKFIKKCAFYSTANVFTGLPYLGDYTHPWTDEMLYEYFNLTPEEIKEIENEL